MTRTHTTGSKNAISFESIQIELRVKIKPLNFLRSGYKCLEMVTWYLKLALPLCHAHKYLIFFLNYSPVITNYYGISF